MMTKQKWRPFLDARAWAHERHLRSEKQWRELYKHGALPSDIPSGPDYVYRDQWKSWGDFLGTGHIASQNRHYRSFEAARLWAREQGIKSYTEWQRLGAEKRLPEDIPTNVKQVYKSEWKGVADFLGNDYVATYKRKYRSFALAREWAHIQGIKSETQWRIYSKKPGWRPRDIPHAVDKIYKSDDWISWGDFLGTGYVANQKRHYLPFPEARKWARDQRIKSLSDWNKRIKVPGWLPGDIPNDPRNHYGADFTSGDFFGTGSIAPSKNEWRPFAEAKAWAREQLVDSSDEWRELARSLKAEKLWPKDIPTNVSLAYKNNGWQGWEDFLGVQRMAKRSKVEERLRHELAKLLPAIDLKVRSIPITGARVQVVDICVPTLQLVIEFDGNYWHGTNDSEKRDKAKTQMLQNAGWTVVRIRECPLGPISSMDLQIPKKQSTFKLTVAVIKHLSSLGHVSRDTVEQYEAEGRIINASDASSAIRETWLPFEQTRAWTRAQGIKSQAQWSKRLKQDGWLPNNIPRYPLEVYRDQCATWGEFLGTDRKATFQREYRTFEQAREWARLKLLRSRTEWNKLVKQEGWLPIDIPSSVDKQYKKEWISWGDFLGTGNVAPGSHKWRPFTSARQWAQEQQLSTRAGWHVLVKNNALPPGIPASPQTVYASEWMGWRDFLGTNNQNSKSATGASSNFY